MKLKTVAETGCAYVQIKRARRRVLEFNMIFLQGLSTLAAGGVGSLTDFSAVMYNSGPVFL